MQRNEEWLNTHSTKALKRLYPRIEARFKSHTEEAEWEAYSARLNRHFPQLFGCLYDLYGTNYEFYYHMESILASATEMWLQRPLELKALDALREADPLWYQSSRVVGAMCYVDLFAQNLQGLREKIPYLSDLGVTYLHLMPVFKVPKGDNDGGYAVSSYRETRPDLGSMDDLAELATELRLHGISLTLDFVFNHTSDEHEWARQALQGDEEYQSYYRMFPDRNMPDAYERTMPEVFTEDHPGAFVYHTRIKKWVWTTFHTYQWDLNYENPVVFNRMLEEMLFLANQGVEILRLDAVAFIWKQLGTNSQNLPQAHWIIQAFNAIVKIAAPAMVFKSEAIVHPDEVSKYISLDECPLSYNPQLMALLWESLATRDTRVLTHAMRRRFAIPKGCSWVNYVRCHDDVGWAFANDDVKAIGFDPDEHRRFLTQFFTGRFKDSFSTGVPFQVDPRTGDARVAGMATALTGIEKAIKENDEEELTLSIDRMLLLYGVSITMAGIPLLYLGDEIALMNDYDYESDPSKVGDSRWINRPVFDWKRAEQHRDMESVPGRVYHGIRRYIQLRSQHKAFDDGETEFIDTENKHVFGFVRSNDDSVVYILANFSENKQSLEARKLRQMGMRKTMMDLNAGRVITATRELELAPYQLVLLAQLG